MARNGISNCCQSLLQQSAIGQCSGGMHHASQRPSGRVDPGERLHHCGAIGDIQLKRQHLDACRAPVGNAGGCLGAGRASAEERQMSRAALHQPLRRGKAESGKSARDKIEALRIEIAEAGTGHARMLEHDLSDMTGRGHESERFRCLRKREDAHGWRIDRAARRIGDHALEERAPARRIFEPHARKIDRMIARVGTHGTELLLRPDVLLADLQEYTVRGERAHARPDEIARQRIEDNIDAAPFRDRS